MPCFVSMRATVTCPSVNIKPRLYNWHEKAPAVSYLGFGDFMQACSAILISNGKIITVSKETAVYSSKLLIRHLHSQG